MNYTRIPAQERTIWISRTCAEVKNLRKLQFRGNRSGSSHVTRMPEQTWCQKMQEGLEEDSLRQTEG